jgi:hypothetical protein
MIGGYVLGLVTGIALGVSILKAARSEQRSG